MRDITLPLIVLLSVCCGAFSNEHAKRFEEFTDTPIDQLPEDLRRKVRDVDPLDQNNTCCRINNTKTVNASITATEQYQQSYQEAYHGCCTLFCTGAECTFYRQKYRTAIRYVTKYVSQLKPIACPDQHVVCCNGYIKLAGRCIMFSHLGDLLNPDNTVG